MLAAVEPLRGSNGDDRDGSFAGVDDFTSTEALLEDINFGYLFDVGIDDGDILRDLELDPVEIFAEFSVGGEEDSGTTTTMTAKEAGEAVLGVDGGSTQLDLAVLEGATTEEKDVSHGVEVVSAVKEENASVVHMPAEVRSASPDGDKDRKSSAAKGSLGKRKAKVDWTPELHRRFVQAVEQLGIDKAVPSRILELMGIDCLTRHNIASHLQKYRSHRKHLLAREAEAANWSQRRQMYTMAGTGGGSGAKRDTSPWLAPTIVFPPPPPTVVGQHFRPLHVWGHPTAEAPVFHMWPPHLAPRSPTLLPWAAQPPLPPPPDPSYWHHHHFQKGSNYREGWIPHAMTQGTPCFPQPLPAPRFPVPSPVPGLVPHPMYRQVPPPMTKQLSKQLQLDAHPSKESIDAAIGDVLAKPWLPLPLGLKAPPVESVLVELQKQCLSLILHATVTWSGNYLHDQSTGNNKSADMSNSSLYP